MTLVVAEAGMPSNFNQNSAAIPPDKSSFKFVSLSLSTSYMFPLPSKIDVVFVPLLAFDKNGHRIGYGKGYYDKFLSSCKPDIIKIGLSFYEAEEAFQDVYPSDIPLDYCVTPKKVYRF